MNMKSMKIESIKNNAKKLASSAKEFVNSEAGVEAGRGVGFFFKRIAANKYVINTLAAGFGGALVGYLTFLPVSFCMTVAMVFGLYNTITSK